MKPYKFDPVTELGINIPKNKRREALEAAAEILKEAVLDFIGEGKSPVSGFGKFPGYTKKYKDYKSELSSASNVNLELTGEMLDALSVEVSGSNLKVFVDGDSELQGKAEGNNLGTYGNQKPLPGKARRFIPLKEKDEVFKRDILRQIKDVLKKYEDGED